jgi:hypothetical protein
VRPHLAQPLTQGQLNKIASHMIDLTVDTEGRFIASPMASDGTIDFSRAGSGRSPRQAIEEMRP